MDRVSLLRQGAMRAVIFGSGSYPDWTALNSASITKSATNMAQYLTDELGLTTGDVLNLFETGGGQDVVGPRIAEYITESRAEGYEDILLYYCGHGLTPTAGGGLRLTVAHSKESARDTTTISLDSLAADILRAAGADARLFWVVDACYGSLSESSFAAPWGNAGVAILSASSREDVADTDGPDDSTLFTGTLLRVLRRGDPRPWAMLSFRQVREMVEREIALWRPAAAIRPEVHAPHQRGDDLTEEPLFPNKMYSSALDFRAPTGGKPWVVLLSEYDAKCDATNQPSIRRELEILTSLLPPEIEQASGWKLRTDPDVFHTDGLLETARRFQDVVATLCQADIAVIDVTSYEPITMLLLGIRAVIRRGITICINHRLPTELENSVWSPFSIRELNLIRFPTADFVNVMRDRIIAGIRTLTNAPSRYQDLPAFEALRHPPLDRPDTSIIPYYEQVLMLCSFGGSYQERNYSTLIKYLQPTIRNHMVQDDTVGELFKVAGAGYPRLTRTLDMSTPRIVSQALFEAIRSTDFCLVDLTSWRPDVLFELGVRLASARMHPVCIFDDTFDDLSTDQRFVEQERRILFLLDAKTYNGAMLDVPAVKEIHGQYIRYQSNLGRDLDFPALAGPEELPHGSIYDIAWMHARENEEPSGMGAVDLLLQSASDMSYDQDQGNARLIFPRSHPMNKIALQNGLERRIAAWLYLHYRISVENMTTGTKEYETYMQLSLDIAGGLRPSVRPEDAALREHILDQYRIRKAAEVDA